MPIEHLTELQYSQDRRGPFTLYIYLPNSDYHTGRIYFADVPQYPEEGEITTLQAKERCEKAIAEGREVRICDSGDMLVYHAKAGKILYGETFWQEVAA